MKVGTVVALISRASFFIRKRFRFLFVIADYTVILVKDSVDYHAILQRQVLGNMARVYREVHYLKH